MSTMTPDEKQRADENNANLVRQGAKIAKTFGGPQGQAIGRGIEAADKLTGGRVGDALGRGLTNATNAMPGGKRLQDGLNKASESGAADKLGKAADTMGGEPHKKPQASQVPRGHSSKAPQGPDSSDPAVRGLQNNRQNRSRNNNVSRPSNKTENNLTNPLPNPNPFKQAGTEDDKKETRFEETMYKGLKRLAIKAAVSLILILMIVAIPVMALAGIFGGSLASTVPMVNSQTYGTDKFQPIYDEGTSANKEEVAYYEKIKKVGKNYEDEYGEELKISYIHKILISVYYEYGGAPDDDVVPVDDDTQDDTSNDETGTNKEESSNNDETKKNQDAGSQNSQEEIFDFKKMSSMIDTIYKLMAPKGNINYEKNGDFYNNLKNSSEFKKYYKNVISQRLNASKDGETEEKILIDILDNIFDEAKELSELNFDTDEMVITGEVNITVSDKQDTNNKNNDTKKTLTINEYLADSIYANTNSVSNGELVKAYTVAYSTNIVAQNKNLSITSNGATMTNQTCSTKEGCSYDKDGKLVSGAGDRNNNNATYYNGVYYYKPPLSNTENDNLNKNINSVFGNVLVNKDGTYPTLDVTAIGGLGDGNGDYKSIITTSYGSELSYKNVGENNYILDGNYGTKKLLTNVIFYDQNNYPTTRFCGLAGYSVARSGCGVTSMAIVASTYENNKKYDPVYMNNEATRRKMCGGGDTGTKQAFFNQMAKAMRYKYLSGSKYDKSFLNQILKHLSQGHLVVVRMGPGHFTSGGHYMVLGGVDPATKKVYVYDPYNKVNKGYRGTGNGWYSFNDIIVKEAYNFYIIWKG